MNIICRIPSSFLSPLTCVLSGITKTHFTYEYLIVIVILLLLLGVTDYSKWATYGHEGYLETCTQRCGDWMPNRKSG